MSACLHIAGVFPPAHHLSQMGGMAEVYRVVDAQSCPFALKVMRLDRLDASAWLRFDRESKILAQLKGSSSVVWLLDRGELADGRPYVVMPYVEGASLRDIVELGHPSPHDCLRIALGISDFASPPDPTNLSPRRITAPHPMRASLGTQGFIAPEQAQGNIAATPADLWTPLGPAPRTQDPYDPRVLLSHCLHRICHGCFHPQHPRRQAQCCRQCAFCHRYPAQASRQPHFSSRDDGAGPCRP